MEEARFRRKARWVILGVTLMLVTAIVAADIVSQMFSIGTFRANEAILGTLFGGALLIGGLTLPKLFGRK